MGDNAPPPPANEGQGGADNIKSEETPPFELLKTLHAASFNRWEKRRNYEWLLSYAIWGALAGFIAVVVFGKDSQFRAPENWLPTAGWLLAVFMVHSFYLFFMVDSTLRDLKAQRIFENKIWKLLKDKEFEEAFRLTQRFAGRDPNIGDNWFMARYGLWSQIMVTAILCIAAFWASSAKRDVSETPPTVGAGGTLCQGCTQYLTPPAAAPADAPNSPVQQRNTKH